MTAADMAAAQRSEYSAERAGHRPPRGYSWAPFEAGNTAAVKSGARSPRLVAPLAEQFLAEIYEDAPWTQAPAFRHTMESLAWTQAQLALIYRWLDEHGLGLDEDSLRPILSYLNSLEVRIAKLRDAQGLTAMSLVNMLGKLAQHEPEALPGGAREALGVVGAQIRQAAQQRQIEAATAQEVTDGQD